MTTAIAALPFMGGELSSFDPSSSSVTEATGSSTFNYSPPYARCGIKIPPGNSMTSPTWPVAATFTLHTELQMDPPTFPAINALIFQAFNGATEVMRILGNGKATQTLTFYTLQSGSLTLVGSMVISNPGLVPPAVIDFTLVAGGSGSLTVLSAGTQVFTSSGLNHSGFAGVTQIKAYSYGSDLSGLSGAAYWSQIICDTVSHVGDHLYTLPLNANSAVNLGWTGSVTDINEVVLNDANFVSAATAALVSTYLAAGFSLSGLNVLGIGVAARAKTTGGGPQNLDLALRVAGANFFSGNIGLNAGYQACFNSWVNNPATSATWLAAAAQAVEGGQKSIA